MKFRWLSIRHTTGTCNGTLNNDKFAHSLHTFRATALTNLVPSLKLVRDKMRDTKMPEFVIHPFGNIRGCPKNILNQFKKQIFRTASDGNGWIIHDGISDMAKLMADAVKAG